MKKWEYRIERCKDILSTIDLNVLGKLGWELVSVAVSPGGFGYNFECVFKRELS